MALWGVAGAAYGLVMMMAAVTRPTRRRALLLSLSAAYALVAVGAATVTASVWMSLFAPGVLLLCGYWLSGSLFDAPQVRLEAWLLGIDRALGADRWMARVPRLLAELLEASYASASLIVGVGAIVSAAVGTDAVVGYWNLVLPASLAAYAPLPWVRTRPPRVLEGTDTPAHARGARRPALRRLNAAILDAASVQVNTLPSGHVSAVQAAALALLPIAPTLGQVLLVMSAVIGLAAVAGRYHYAVDCVAGAIVAWLLWVAL